LNSTGEVIAMRELRARGAQRVVVTAGKETTLAFDGQRTWEIASPEIEAVNPIGSGDSFTAGVVWRLVAGDTLGEACRWGAACGAANALTLMAGEVRREDMERLVQDVKVHELNT
jgi:fructose-1-phosphate kinase PfkB-like protein